MWKLIKMQKKKIIIANWKMNPTSLKEAEILFTKIIQKSSFKKTEVVICPPFLYLPSFVSILIDKEKLKGTSKKITLGAQDIFYEERGAFTGEISGQMLIDFRVKHVIIGHSERRKLGETNSDVNKKIKMTLFFGLKPIVCIGETERDKNHGYFNVVRNQIEECLNNINKDLIGKIIIAYEPVWALSTTEGRKDATPVDSCEMAVFIKKILTDKFGSKTKLPSIIYGGSVNDKNCRDFLTEGGIDGVMPGAASLNADKFLEIINIAEKI
jgi:triosephosphate isomerase (TIM)